MKVIVVDDEIASLSTFLAHLIDKSEVEYQFFQNNPKAAISYAALNKVDGAFLDINMPEMNGVDLAKELIKRVPSIKIVFITGYTYDVDEIKKSLGDNLLGFGYKPFDSTLINHFLQEISFQSKKPKIFAKTFGPFDLFVNQSPVRFSSSKSKELLALLVVYRGSMLTMDDCIGHLWPEKDLDLAKLLYRDAIWRLRKSLKEAGLLFLVNFARGSSSLCVDCLDCDYWSYLKKKDGNYHGSFLPGYDWSMEYQDELDAL
jgi:two-component system, LytTR family, response regulator